MRWSRNLGGDALRLVARDYEVLREVDRWSCVLGRHVRFLAGFASQSPCDRRIRLLIEAGYLERRHYLYGMPGLLGLTYQGRMLIGVSKNAEKPRVDQIAHDIAVLDTVVYFMLKEGVPLSDIQSEKQLHGIDGFARRRHRPDFIYSTAGKTYCVEVELSLKSKDRFEQNMKQNFDDYETQTWVVPKAQVKITEMLQRNANTYPNIQIIQLEEVESYVRNYGKSES